ncbi:MAG: hypothetical protein M3O30_17565 [Planctomycetota bacterium]|nr:hypothetical protein [Planctomycetota bacterium]
MSQKKIVEPPAVNRRQCRAGEAEAGGGAIVKSKTSITLRRCQLVAWLPAPNQLNAREVQS